MLDFVLDTYQKAQGIGRKAQGKLYDHLDPSASFRGRWPTVGGHKLLQDRMDKPFDLAQDKKTEGTTLACRHYGVNPH